MKLVTVIFLIISTTAKGYGNGGFAGGGGGFIRQDENNRAMLIDLYIFYKDRKFMNLKNLSSDSRYQSYSPDKDKVTTLKLEDNLNVLKNHLDFIRNLLEEQSPLLKSHFDFQWMIYEMNQVEINFLPNNQFEKNHKDGFSIKNLSKDLYNELDLKKKSVKISQAAYMQRGDKNELQSKKIYINIKNWNRLGFIGQSALLFHELFRILQMPYSSKAPAASKVQHFNDKSLLLITGITFSCEYSRHLNSLLAQIATNEFTIKEPIESLRNTIDCKLKEWK